MARMRSMAVDMNDENAISHEVGWDTRKHSATMLPMVPFFFTPQKWSAPLVDMFRGGSAFLIASGPSFKDVNKAMLSKPGVWTMTINNSVKSFRGNAAIVVDDPARFVASLWLDPKIMKFVPTSHFRKPIWDNRTLLIPGKQPEQCWAPMNINVGDCPNVWGYQRNEKFHAPRFLREETINWGNHKRWGGGRSVLMAATRILYLLGFRRVYLVGVDFEMNDQKRYHFDEGRTDNAIKGNMSTYSKMVNWFTELKPLFDKEGFVIKNCNPASGLRVFPFTTVEEAVAEATVHLGDVENERTRGMYVDFNDKMATWQAIQREQTMTVESRDRLIDEQERKARSAQMDD